MEKNICEINKQSNLMKQLYQHQQTSNFSLNDSDDSQQNVTNSMKVQYSITTNNKVSIKEKYFQEIINCLQFSNALSQIYQTYDKEIGTFQNIFSLNITLDYQKISKKIPRQLISFKISDNITQNIKYPQYKNLQINIINKKINKSPIQKQKVESPIKQKISQTSFLSSKIQQPNIKTNIIKPKSKSPINKLNRKTKTQLIREQINQNNKKWKEDWLNQKQNDL